jgi:hypothetical protein
MPPQSSRAAGALDPVATGGLGVAARAPRCRPRSISNDMLRPIALALLIGLPLATAGATPDAAPAVSEPAGPPPVADVEKTNILDTTRGYVRDAVEWTASGVDSWFGDKPFEQGGRVAGSIGLSFLWRQDEGVDWLTRFRVRLDLPNLRDRAFVFVGRDNERELVTDRPEGFTRREQLLQETRDEQSFFAGLGTQFGKLVSLRAGFRGGLKPYAQARLFKAWDLGPRDLVEFRETVFWTVDDGFGSTTALNYGHLFGPLLALRWQGAATWAQKTEGVEWGSSVGLYRTFDFQRQLALEALVSGQTGGDAEISEYGVRTRWEQPVYKDWLLTELILGYFWPRRNSITERGRTWAFGAGIQMRF